MEELALAEEPVTLEVSPDGGYLAAMNNRSVDMIDLETGEASNYGMESGKLNWLDASMLYEVRKGEITVWDFDGENMRNLASSGQILKEKKINALSFPVLLSENGRWIYYLTTGKNDTTLLVREKIKD